MIRFHTLALSDRTFIARSLRMGKSTVPAAAWSRSSGTMPTRGSYLPNL
jgi:hypothetical protein